MSRGCAFALTLAAEWLDLVLLGMVCLVLAMSNGALPLVLAVLLAYNALGELLEMASSMVRYLKFYKNWTDLILLLLTCTVLYLPNSAVQNPAGWSLNIHGTDNPAEGKPQKFPPKFIFATRMGNG